jgi:hypothetical protein
MTDPRPTIGAAVRATLGLPADTTDPELLAHVGLARLALDTAGADPTAALRTALAQCLTLADIEHEMGWAPGTGARHRWRPEPAGLPEPDHFFLRTPVWFRSTIAAWRHTRPGMGHRPGPAGRAAAHGRRTVPDPPSGWAIVQDGMKVVPGGPVLAYVHGSWRPVTVAARWHRSMDVRYRLDGQPPADTDPPEDGRGQRVGISRVAVPIEEG